MQDESKDGGVGYEYSHGAVLKNNLSNLVRFLEGHPGLQGRFGLDTWGRSKMVKLPLPWDDGTGTRRLTDADVLNLRLEAEKYGMAARASMMEDAVAVVCGRRQWNPVRQTLMELEAGESRLGSVLSTYLNARSPHIDEIERLLFTGVVARILNPGTKFDYMPILQGRQGIGKSTICRLLALSSELYTDYLGDISQPRQWWYQTNGKSIVEVSELSAFAKTKSIEDLKSFIVRETDEWCPNYGKELVSRPRTFVLIGTTNETRYLADPTGNRRFIPIICNAVSAHPGLFDGTARKDIECALAEARDLVLQGKHRLTLSVDAKAAVECDCVAAMLTDPVPGKVIAFMRSTELKRVSLRTIIREALGIDGEHGNSALSKHVKEIALTQCSDIWEWRDGIRLDEGTGNGFVRRSEPL